MSLKCWIFEKEYQQVDPTDPQSSEKQRWVHLFLSEDLMQTMKERDTAAESSRLHPHGHFTSKQRAVSHLFMLWKWLQISQRSPPRHLHTEVVSTRNIISKKLFIHLY